MDSKTSETDRQASMVFQDLPKMQESYTRSKMDPYTPFNKFFWDIYHLKDWLSLLFSCYNYKKELRQQFNSVWCELLTIEIGLVSQ